MDLQDIRNLSRWKLLLIVDILFLIALAVSSAGSMTPIDDTNLTVHNQTEVTFIATQGGSAQLYPHAGEIQAVHNPSKQVIWRNDDYRRYMDVDVLDNDTILTVAGNYTNGEVRRVALIFNWREDRLVEKFQVPHDVHDIDYLGNNEYAIADKANARAYVYNPETDNITWEYDFREYFTDDGGPGTHEYTHLNDIDPEMNQSAFLLSPRNFDRVFLINRSNKEIIFELGEEDNYDILYEQHNPDMLSYDPYTVIVSDSENDRIIEYQQQEDGSWVEKWSYSGELNWPRDGDRLPNGNTLITDTVGNRVVEVTPRGGVVWEYDTPVGPYEAERYGTPDGSNHIPFNGTVEPEEERENAVESSFDKLYSLVGHWIMPAGTGKVEFAGFMLLALINMAYIGFRIVESSRNNILS